MVEIEAGAVEEAEEEGEEEREVEEEEWKEVEGEDMKEDVVVRGSMRGSLEMEEPESRPRTSVEEVVKGTGEPSRMMPRKEKRMPTTPLLRKPHLLRVKLLLRERSRKKVLRTRSLLRRK